MAGIFVSYRRDDSQGFAGRLADDLTDIFGSDRVFRDIEIPVGCDFTEVLSQAIAASDLLLVVIGRHWAGESEQGYGSRLFEQTDWVRIEIEAAFDQGKQVVPVLVGGASMPGHDSLPGTIEKLARLQTAILNDRYWDTQVRELAERLQGLCPSLTLGLPGTENRESPAAVLRDLGERVFKEIESYRPARIQLPTPPATIAQKILRQMSTGLKGLFSIAFTLGLIYVGIRLLGDDKMLHQMDLFEVRLQLAWERLQLYMARP